MKEIKREFQVKEGRNWRTEHVDTDITNIYRFLSGDLISKKINGSDFIRSIKRVNNYDGTQTITVTYAMGTRNVYTIMS